MADTRCKRHKVLRSIEVCRFAVLPLTFKNIVLSYFIFCQEKAATDVSLDKYLSQNVSEDSMSFVEIMEESNKRHRVKHAWLFEKEEEQEKVCHTSNLDII